MYKKRSQQTGGQWLTPVILATQEAEIRRITVRRQPKQIVHETLSVSKTPITKKGLVKWFKVKALSSSPSTTKKTHTASKHSRQKVVRTTRRNQ
jgi:hypothetical protein